VWLRLTGIVGTGAILGLILALAAFLVTSARTPGPRLATGCPVDITREPGFDPWTGLPYGQDEVAHCPGGPTELHQPIPADLVGRRAISLPQAFPIGWLIGTSVAAAIWIVRRDRRFEGI
jgi:hypothetical protein